MKKIQLMLIAITLCTTTSAAQLELKTGLEPFREGENSHADFNIGASFGAELLFNCDKNTFDYGFGIERKSHLRGDNSSSNRLNGANAYPIYLTGKTHMYNELYYIVGRLGWSMYENARAEDGIYAGLGIGKQYGPVTLEGMYELMDVNTNSKLYSSDRTGIFSLKIGYRFGENRRDTIAKAKEDAARVEYERYQEAKTKREEGLLLAEKEAKLEGLREQAILEKETRNSEIESRLRKEEARMMMLENYESIIITATFGVDEVTTYELDRKLMNNINGDLAEESGVIEIRTYTDNLGSDSHNEFLSQKRADRVAEEIRGGLTNNNIEVTSKGMGNTNYLNDNSTPDLRRENRRVELKFIAS